MSSTRVEYHPNLRGDCFFNQAESLADKCRAPVEWVKTELGFNSRKRIITKVSESNIESIEVASKQCKGVQKLSRIVCGCFLSIPGIVAAVPLRVIASFSEEVCLKRQIKKEELSPENRKRLSDLIARRQTLEDIRKECEPVTCILCMICMLIFCQVCC